MSVLSFCLLQTTSILIGTLKKKKQFCQKLNFLSAKGETGHGSRYQTGGIEPLQ